MTTNLPTGARGMIPSGSLSSQMTNEVRQTAIQIASVYGRSPANMTDQQYRQYEQIERWKKATADFFRRVCSTITVREVPVVFGERNGEIAWTDGESVFLGEQAFYDSLERLIVTNSMHSATGPIVRIKGAAMHELSHILYTPRRNAQPLKNLLMAQSALETWILPIMRTFNILEDSRIENRFVSRYPGAIPYFTEMAGTYITSDICLQENPVMVYVLSCGRYYLPSTVRVLAKNLASDILKDDAVVKRIKSITDEYNLLSFPKDAVRGEELVLEMARILKDLGFNQPNDSPDDTGQSASAGSHGNNWSRGTPQSNREQSKAAADVQQMLEEADEEDEQNTAGASATGNEPAEDEQEDGASGSSGADGSGDESGDSGGGADDSSDDTSGGEPTGGSASGGGSADKTADGATNKRIADEIQKQLDNATSKSQLIKDGYEALKSISKKVGGLKRDTNPNLRGAKKSALDSSMKRSSNKIVDAFNTIRAEGDDVWDAGHSSGRLNTGLAMNARGAHFDVFNQWVDLGDDATSFEIVILVDQSGSMLGYKQEAVSQGLWIVANACRQLDIPVTAIGYDDEAWLLFDSERNVPANEYHTLTARGSTEPAEALAWASEIFTASEKTHKILFSLTDGEWHTNLMTEEVMRSFHKTGVHSSLIIQGEPRYNAATNKSVFMFPYQPKDKYGHKHMHTVGDAKVELPAVVFQAIKQIASDVINSGRI